VLVDSSEGPMPQTRFVLSKALECRLKPVVVISKIDRPDARSNEVLDEVFDLFLDLGADDDLADFPHIFVSGRGGYATHDPAVPGTSIHPLLDLVLETVPGPDVEPDASLQMLVTNFDWSEYVGKIGIGRIQSGVLRRGQQVALMQKDGTALPAKITSVFVFDKLGRREVEEATAGDIAAVVGLENVAIGDTISDLAVPRALPRVTVDEPTLQMTFGINGSPLSGQEGRFLTSRHIRERLLRETEKNVALRVEVTEGADSFQVSGRGLLHLSVLIETMRREGYELSIGKPRVILHQRDGVVEEPFESLVVEVPSQRMGPVMELVGGRRGQIVEMTTHGSYTYLVFSIPARGLLGLRTRLLNATQGTAIMHHRFECYKALEGDIPGRETGVLVSMVPGRAVAYALDGLQDRAEMFVAPGDDVYEGMIVGENARSGDMPVNPTREKKLTNIRAAAKDDNVILKPPRLLSLEAALEYIEEDELVEVTPTKTRLRKATLSSMERKRQARKTL
jgi:GTP-binding protein